MSRDLTGETFCELVVMKQNGKTKNGECKWLCLCSCGNSTTVTTGNLVRGGAKGGTKSCGCKRSQLISEGILKSLVGKRFGKLVVVKRYGEIGEKEVRWECVCDCGNIKITSCSNLKSGHTSSCGCLSSASDITGETFGKWTVIKRTGIDSNKNILWLCKCQCGNERQVTGNRLKNGQSFSCGCLHKHEWKGQTFRSKWEAWMSMRYDILGIRWEYESKTLHLMIDGEMVKYTPDFVLDNGCMIEVKGREWYGKRDALRPTRKAIEMGYDLMIYKQKDIEMILSSSIYELDKAYTTGGFSACDALIRSRVV